MPDRRQGDRRESSSFQSKKISISLSTLISIAAIILIIFMSAILCRLTYLKGYDNGFSEGYSEALYDTGYIFEYDDENSNILE